MSMKVRFFMFFLLVMTTVCLAADSLSANEPVETICYGVEPVGSSIYQDFGTVDFQGKKLNLVVFKTDVLGFKDTEDIYSDLVTGKPVHVERNVAFWMNKEYLVEEYSLKDFSVTISKFKDNKKTQEYNFKGSAPLDNAVIVPFSLRKAPGLAIGWTRKIVLPEEFIVKLDNIEEVSVPAGKFKAYHFTSEPPKFEVWISADSARLPVKIRGLGGLGYTLSMKKYAIKDGGRKE